MLTYCIFEINLTFVCCKIKISYKNCINWQEWTKKTNDYWWNRPSIPSGIYSTSLISTVSGLTGSETNSANNQVTIRRTLPNDTDPISEPAQSSSTNDQNITLNTKKNTEEVVESIDCSLGVQIINKKIVWLLIVTFQLRINYMTY